MDELAAFTGTVAAWVDHLRAGGTTPWLTWVDHAGRVDHRAPLPDPADLPGAGQLELLRRLNLEDPTHADALADRILTRAGPGRGPTELPLRWPAAPGLTAAGRVGTPVDPAALPAGELLRVGAGLLADLVRELPLPETGVVEGGRSPRAPWESGTSHETSPVGSGRTSASHGTPTRSLWRGRRPSFVLDGPPRTVAALRTALADLGLHEHRPRLDWLGGRRPPTRPDVVVVPLLPFDDLLGEVWEERARRGSPRGWRRFVQGLTGRDALPPGADPASTAARWARRVGPGRVHLLTPDRLDDALRDLLGVRVPVRADRLAPVLVDVLRRHHAVQSLHLPETDRQPRTDLLVGVLEEMAATGPGALAVPAGCRPWALDTGARLAAACGGYAGAGDPAVLAQVRSHAPTERPSRLEHRSVLPAMTEAILRVATRVQEVRR